MGYYRVITFALVSSFLQKHRNNIYVIKNRQEHEPGGFLCFQQESTEKITLHTERFFLSEKDTAKNLDKTLICN